MPTPYNIWRLAYAAGTSDEHPRSKKSPGEKDINLHHFLLFAIFAILSGAKSYRDVNRFIAEEIKRISNYSV